MKNYNSLTDSSLNIFHVFENFNVLMTQITGIMNILNSLVEKSININHNSSDFGKS